MTEQKYKVLKYFYINIGFNLYQPSMYCENYHTDDIINPGVLSEEQISSLIENNFIKPCATETHYYWMHNGVELTPRIYNSRDSYEFSNNDGFIYGYFDATTFNTLLANGNIVAREVEV
jgi:hypothetical protein